MSWHRITALMLRHLYTTRRNPSRIFDMVFWPAVDLVIWGFLSVFLFRTGTQLPAVAAIILGGFILWDILFRAHVGTTVTYLEDQWSRNSLNLFASPLTLAEYILSIVLISFLRVLVGACLTVGLAWAFFHFNLLSLGAPLLLFFFGVLAMGWALGLLTTAIMIRFGHSAETLAWAFVAFFAPFSAVYYPLAVLPHWAQAIAQIIPAAHVFEGMRQVIAGNGVSWERLGWAFALDTLYMIAAVLVLTITFRRAKMKGRLVRSWE